VDDIDRRRRYPVLLASDLGENIGHLVDANFPLLIELRVKLGERGGGLGHGGFLTGNANFAALVCNRNAQGFANGA
jgi:hypothetical protein